MAVVECKSISGASEKVFLSQPAITQAIAKIERALGETLFVRRSDGMYPTQAGDLFAVRVERGIALLNESLRTIARLSARQASLGGGSALAFLTTTQLRALIAVCEVENFSLASRNMGISQPSLHRSARDLESKLGVMLFEKTSTGISATKAARGLARAAKLAYAEFDQGRDEVASLRDDSAGRLIVGSMPLARTSVLPAAILAFLDKHPSFAISVNDGPYDDLIQHLRNGDIDVLIGALRYPEPGADVIQEPLFHSSIEICARPGHPLLDQSDVTIEDLASARWAIPRKGTPTRRIFESVFRKLDAEPPTAIVETGSLVMIRSLLASSDTMTMISRHQVQQELENGELVTVPYDLGDTSRVIGITCRSGWKPTGNQVSFVEELRQQAQLVIRKNAVDQAAYSKTE